MYAWIQDPYHLGICNQEAIKHGILIVQNYICHLWNIRNSWVETKGKTMCFDSDSQIRRLETKFSWFRMPNERQAKSLNSVGAIMLPMIFTKIFTKSIARIFIDFPWLPIIVDLFPLIPLIFTKKSTPICFAKWPLWCLPYCAKTTA